MCSRTSWVWVTNLLVLVSELMPRYATAPITTNNRNASVNPAAIFLPKVHMSSLLVSSLLRRRAVLTAASLNHFHQRRDADHRADQTVRTRHIFNVPARYVFLAGCEHLRRRDPEIAFQVAETQSGLILISK